MVSRQVRIRLKKNHSFLEYYSIGNTQLVCTQTNDQDFAIPREYFLNTNKLRHIPKYVVTFSLFYLNCEIILTADTLSKVRNGMAFY